MLNDIERSRHYITQEINEGEIKNTYDRYLSVNKLQPDFYKDKIVLDLGCGWGVGLQAILDKGAQMTIGIDANKESLSNGRRLYPEGERRRYIESLIFDTPLNSACVDIIVCSETLEHNDYEERDLILKESHRLLKDDGYLYVTTPEKRGDSFPSGSHWIEYTYEELVPLIEVQGFQLVNTLRKDGLDSVSMGLLFKKV